ncbi:MAG: hypothetical protein ACP5T4_04065 [Candidatus Micrarchaeia archaeon]
MALSGKSLFAFTLLISLILLAIMFVVNVGPIVRTLLALLVLFFDIFAFSTKYYAYLFIPLIKAKSKTVVFSSDEPFRISPNGDAIIVNSASGFSASMFVKIPIYKSATEMSDEERIDFSKAFSRMLSISREPTKFITALYVVNKDAYINEIKEKLNEAEEAYASLNSQANVQQNNAALERAEGEVTMWKNLFDNVNKVTSNALGNFAMVTAMGQTEEEALAIAVQKADELVAGISAVLGVRAYVMESKEFLQILEPEQMIPFVTISEQQQEKIASLGV